MVGSPRPSTDSRPRVWLNLDIAQNGLGTAACGPGVLPAYQLIASNRRLELEITSS
ncbi:hypothetical protein [Compostimonas suwonensis]|uniref:hypothetical protein n=1 Tax=Compostimonas suwonensis TaxID=1048394 RepID=UPI0012FDCED6